MISENPRLLLVGQKLKAMASLVERLESRGCAWEFVETVEDARRTIDRRAFDVVLVDSQLPDGAAYSLIRIVMGTRSNLFFWVPLERSGCLLPVVLRGQHQFRSSVVRPPAYSETLSLLLWSTPAGRQVDVAC
jgi:CheY-like chemotaxis protein